MIKIEEYKKMISYKVMKTDDFDDSVFYRIACGCGNKNHEFELWLEYDEDINDITLMIEKTVYWKYHYELSPLYEKIYKRLFAALKLIFGGYLEMQADVLFMDKKHIEGFIEALQEGIVKIDNDPKPTGPPNQEVKEGEIK
jgi:hypothetical protein